MEPFLEIEISGYLMKELVLPLQKVAQEATVHYSPGGILLVALHPLEIVTLVLEIGNFGFDYFSCQDGGVAGVDLVELFDFLKLAVSEESISIQTDEEKDHIISFLIERAFGSVEKEIRWTEVTDERVDSDLKLQSYEYDVELEIRSREFRNIFYCLARSLEIGLVFITVTNEEVEFAAINTKFVLTAEKGECRIRGVGEKDPVFFIINLHYYALFLHLSFLSEVVSILHSHEAPPMLNFPVADIHGSIMFYFTS